MAQLIQGVGGVPFIDIFDIKKGDKIEEKIHFGLDQATELVALLTPWSIERNWVWSEIAAAWAMRKRFVGVMYGLTIEEIEKNRGGMAVLGPTNVIAIDSFDDYLVELSERIRAGT